MVHIDLVLLGFCQQFNKLKILTHGVMWSKSTVTVCGLSKTSIAVKFTEWIRSNNLHRVQLWK